MKRFFSAVLLFIVTLMSTACFYSNTVDRDITQYRNAEQKIPEYCELLPKSIKENMIIKEYYYQHYIRKLFPRYFLLLHVEYSDADYEAELQRLASYRNSYQLAEKVGEGGFLYDEHCQYFHYPAYIAQYASISQDYEYALLIGNNQIVYIFQECVEKEDLQCSLTYLPKDAYTIDREVVTYDVYDDYILRRYDYEEDDVHNLKLK